MIAFRHIGHRLLASVGGIIILGILGITLTYAMRQEAASIAQNESALGSVADSVAESLAALMQGGHSKVAPDLASRLEKVPGIIDSKILRTDGTEAFVDNLTFERVVQRNPEFEFIPRSIEPVRIVAADDPGLERLRRDGQRVFQYRVQPGGERLVTVMSPVNNATPCHKCHGSDDAVRGVISFTVSMREVDRNVAQTWRLAVLVIATALVGIVALIYWFTHRIVVVKLTEVLRAMDAVAAGDNALRLNAARRDEIGDMARAFNHMNLKLLQTWEQLRDERNKLNTVIHSASTGIVVTDGALRIVLVNRAAEAIVGRDAGEITEHGFLELFDDPEWMRARLENGAGKDSSGILHWQGRILSVHASTIRAGEVIGSAALIRDITEEKRLEARLEQQSITDALTGIYNRRHFDEVIETEFKRWKRYGQPVSVAMIDVDHFKKFNDTHGHDCGDHVLGAIGQVLLELSAPAQIPCRYGGEELIVVMPGVAEDAAVSFAEAIRQRIAALVVDGLQVTASIGVAGLPGHPADSAAALVGLADEALYVAKNRGRNQVRVAGGK
ncbi:MAG: diguanylate cyclase [Rhodocyclales bacterium]|nr:diguanylate cyclase [Rhodocyclales bacterium]